MLFTLEQEAIILMAHFHSGIRNPDGSCTYSLQSCMEQFFKTFTNPNITYLLKVTNSILLKDMEINIAFAREVKSTGRLTVLST